MNIRPIILPPKRYEDQSNTKYDSIRHKPWFSGLAEVRKKIPMLALAASLYENNKHLSGAAAAEECLVCRNELVDYLAFMKGKTKLTEATAKTFQRVLDEAYLSYCEEGAAKSFTTYIIRIAKHYGINPRHVTEVWDTDPTFYPRGYK